MQIYKKIPKLQIQFCFSLTFLHISINLCILRDKKRAFLVQKKGSPFLDYLQISYIQPRLLALVNFVECMNVDALFSALHKPHKNPGNPLKPGFLHRWGYIFLSTTRFAGRVCFGYFHIISRNCASTSFLIISLILSWKKRRNSLLSNNGSSGLTKPFFLLLFIMVWYYHKIILLDVIFDYLMIQSPYHISDVCYIHKSCCHLYH